MADVDVDVASLLATNRAEFAKSSRARKTEKRHLFLGSSTSEKQGWSRGPDLGMQIAEGGLETGDDMRLRWLRAQSVRESTMATVLVGCELALVFGFCCPITRLQTHMQR